MKRGPLRLKRSGGSLGAGKGEKAAKDEAEIPEHIPGSKEQKAKRGLDKRTPAQVKVQEKQQMERILKKLCETRKQREESNRHLDALSDHCHIPKVSGTE